MLRHRSSTFLIVSGVLGIIFGLVATFDPIGSILTLVSLWGWYALIDGVFSIVTALRPESRPVRGYLLLTGVVGVAAGIAVISRPVSSAVTLTWILGIWLLVRGLIELGMAITGHRSGDRMGLVLGGLFWLVAGILIAANPGAALLGISTWIGLMAILWGVMLVASGVLVRRDSRSRTL